MAYWDGSYGKAVTRWHWKQRRVLWPFLQCERSHKFLFLKKAYYGCYYVDWEFDHDVWLSAEEYMLKVLRDD